MYLFTLFVRIVGVRSAKQSGKNTKYYKKESNRMREYKSFSKLKFLAREQMRGTTTTLVCAFLLQELIVFAATTVALSFVPGNDSISNIVYYIVTFIIQLLSGILQAGCCLLYLHAACGMKASVSDLFYCFSNSPDKAIKIQCPLAILNCICMLPSDYMLWKMPSNTLDYNMMMTTYLVTIVCSLVYFVITLGFFPVFYMMLDFEDFSVRDIFTKSWEFMKGQKMRYFLLQLSFFPLIFLSIFTCGIALLWIMPYMNMTSTNFYLDLMAYRNKGVE